MGGSIFHCQLPQLSCNAHSLALRISVSLNWCASQSAPLNPKAVPGQPFCLHYLFPSAALNSSSHNIHSSSTTFASPERYAFSSPTSTGDSNEICSCLLIKTRPICIRAGRGGRPSSSPSPDSARAGRHPGRRAPWCRSSSEEMARRRRRRNGRCRRFRWGQGEGMVE